MQFAKKKLLFKLIMPIYSRLRTKRVLCFTNIALLFCFSYASRSDAYKSSICKRSRIKTQDLVAAVTNKSSYLSFTSRRTKSKICTYVSDNQSITSGERPVTTSANLLTKQRSCKVPARRFVRDRLSRRTKSKICTYVKATDQGVTGDTGGETGQQKRSVSNGFSKVRLSGEVLKENFTDTFYTSLEVTAFLLNQSIFDPLLLENFDFPFFPVRSNSNRKFVQAYASFADRASLADRTSPKEARPAKNKSSICDTGVANLRFAQPPDEPATFTSFTGGVANRRFAQEVSDNQIANRRFAQPPDQSPPVVQIYDLQSGTTGITLSRPVPEGDRYVKGESDWLSPSVKVRQEKEAENQNSRFASGNSGLKKHFSLNIKIGDYLASGDKIGWLSCSNFSRISASLKKAKKRVRLKVHADSLYSYKDKADFYSTEGSTNQKFLKASSRFDAAFLRTSTNLATTSPLRGQVRERFVRRLVFANRRFAQSSYKSFTYLSPKGTGRGKICTCTHQKQAKVFFRKSFVQILIANRRFATPVSPVTYLSSKVVQIYLQIEDLYLQSGRDRSVGDEVKGGCASTNLRFVSRFATKMTQIEDLRRTSLLQIFLSPSVTTNRRFVGRLCKSTICNQDLYAPNQKRRSNQHRSNKSLDKQAFSFPLLTPSSGRVLTISKTQLVIQKTQPVLFYDSANLHVKRGEWVKEGRPILTLTHQTLITGDIVQGIPRIEQLFEAFTSPPPGIKERKTVAQSKFKNVHDTLHSQVRDIFRKYWLKNVLPIAVRKSLEEIQYNIVEMIQKVYLSQGVLIADKHIEIIIRQMTSKGQVLDSGSTGLLLEEVLPIRQIENANLTTPGKKCLYVPAVVGLTTAALTCDSFISAASFQETTRVLSRDAVVGKSDFLRGLKEKVVIGDLISAGTGLDIYFIYNLFAEGLS